MEAGTANHFDIILAGSGLSGYSLLYEAMKRGIWQNQQILVIDRSFGERPNKMISFWASGSTAFRPYSVANWKKLAFVSHAGKMTHLDIGDYEYFSMDSNQLLQTYHQYLLQFPNVVFLEAEVHGCNSAELGCTVTTDKGTFTSTYVFNSLFQKPIIPEKQQYFLQHFKGVQLSLEKSLSNPDEAIIMDYRTDQQRGTTFFYCLPLSEKKLFVEYTLFTKSILSEEQYDEAIQKYLTDVLKITDYTIEEEEKGIIPMTDYNFTRRHHNIIYLGTAGGDTRGSTGYTFMNVQKTIQAIIAAFQNTGTPFFEVEPIGAKDKLYDSTLLSVLDEGTYQGHEIFTDLFQGASAKSIFKFLDAESSLYNDFRVMLSLRKWPFIKHFVKVVFRNLGSLKKF